MISLLLLASSCALGFKLGADACNMRKEGKNDGEILVSLPSLAVEHVASTVGNVVETVGGWISGTDKKNSEEGEKA